MDSPIYYISVLSSTMSEISLRCVFLLERISLVFCLFLLILNLRRLIFFAIYFYIHGWREFCFVNPIHLFSPPDSKMRALEHIRQSFGQLCNMYVQRVSLDTSLLLRLWEWVMKVYYYMIFNINTRVLILTY